MAWFLPCSPSKRPLKSRINSAHTPLGSLAHTSLKSFPEDRGAFGAGDWEGGGRQEHCGGLRRPGTKQGSQTGSPAQRAFSSRMTYHLLLTAPSVSDPLAQETKLPKHTLQEHTLPRCLGYVPFALETGETQALCWLWGPAGPPSTSQVIIRIR